MFPKKILGIKIGWQDRGQVGENYIGDDIVRYSSHIFCRTRLRVGKEKEATFLYCPKCLIKID